jgi:23S rRNA (uracil1939-C5)-methyltransferase/tRNA (uracil-5-)-methyltransferase
VGRNKKFNDHPFPYHAEVELEISTLTNLGAGLGRVPLPGAPPSAPGAQPARPPGGWVIMVPFTLPGERVRVRIYRNHKNYSEADLVSVLAPSPHRVTPRCPLFGRCGGCQYQHLAYAEQLQWKRRQVAELLVHLAGLEFPVAPVIGSPREYGYRSKITPHFSTPRRGKINPAAPEKPAGPAPESGPAIGFLKQGSRFELVDVPACPIATPEINAKLAEVRAETRARLAAGDYDRGATLLLRQAQEGVVTDYEAVIHEVIPQVSAPQSAVGDPLPASGSRLSREAPPLRLHFLARDFFQNNPFLLPAFTGYVREQAAASGAKYLVDAYCGSGLFALACAPAFARVAGVEISASSVRFAAENAAANGVTNATFQAADAARIFAALEFPPAETVVIIDPPRKGCDAPFLEQLFAYGPRAVVYVSCDPATQMRDLQGFLAAGYALTAVQPFDLFPQTRHLECVITLRRA